MECQAPGRNSSSYRVWLWSTWELPDPHNSGKCPYLWTKKSEARSGLHEPFSTLQVPSVSEEGVFCQRSKEDQCTPLVSAHRRQSQADLCEFKANLVYKVSSRTAKAIQ